jgi:hypothetical protein
MVIVCEGEETEKLYFEKFKERRDGIKIEFPNADKYTDPVNLVHFAKLCHRKYDINVNRDDSVWVLFDAEIPRDRNQRDQQIDQAVRLAGANIKIILSNLQEQAINYARRLNDHHTTLRRDLRKCECNPSTQVFQLVEHIQDLKRANAAR